MVFVRKIEKIIVSFITINVNNDTIIDDSTQNMIYYVDPIEFLSRDEAYIYGTLQEFANRVAKRYALRIAAQHIGVDPTKDVNVTSYTKGSIKVIDIRGEAVNPEEKGAVPQYILEQLVTLKKRLSKLEKRKSEIDSYVAMAKGAIERIEESGAIEKLPGQEETLKRLLEELTRQNMIIGRQKDAIDKLKGQYGIE